MRVRARDILLLAAAAVVIGGCSSRKWGVNEPAKQPRDAFRTRAMPATASPVKVFDEALALVADLQYKQAADKFHVVVDTLDEAGDHRRAAEAVFWFGYCREKMGDLDSAKRQAYHDSARLLYKRLIEYYPKSAAAARATQRLAALKGKTGKP